MEIETLCLPHVIEASRFNDLDYFVRRTAFVICHKAEPLETLLTVLRYLPADSARIVVTNCPPKAHAQLRYELSRHLAVPGATYLVHQKDESIAGIFQECGVSRILDAGRRVVDGKGEGMYIGALVAALLGMPEWLIYFDADNHAPSALLEYTLAMGHLFMASRSEHDSVCSMPLRRRARHGDVGRTSLHNVRVCWASKPTYDGESFVPQPRAVGRCTQVIAPLCDELLRARQPSVNHAVLTPNAGEQGMTIATAKMLRFSSGFSIETFQLLELLLAGARNPGAGAHALLQQYMSGSPHFHQKKDDAHIHGMVAESLGSFLAFQRYLPPGLVGRVAHLASELDVPIRPPATYPALGRLPLARYSGVPAQFLLEREAASALAWHYSDSSRGDVEDPRVSA